MDCDSDRWRLEGEAILCGLSDHVFDLADCVELPPSLGAHAGAARVDAEFSETFDEWFEHLSMRDLLLPVEQSCNAEGILLPWDMRAVRLRTLPPDLLGHLHFFFDHCPRHIQILLVHFVSWLVRFERVGRRGTVAWTVDDVIPEREQSAFFRPPILTFRNYAR